MNTAPSDPLPPGGLRDLDHDYRDAIIDFAREHPLSETVRWLAAGSGHRPGLATTSADLSAFLAAARLQASLERHAAAVNELLGGAGLALSDWPDDAIQEAGQNCFAARAIEERDPQMWAMAQGFMVQRDQLRLEHAKFKENQLSRIHAALDAIAANFDANPEALALYQQAVQLLALKPATLPPPTPEPVQPKPC